VDGVECGGSEDFVAFRGAEARKGKTSDATSIHGELGCVCVCSDGSRFLLKDCLAGGWSDECRDE